MAVKTIYDLYDLLSAEGSIDLSISATDTHNNQNVVISSENAVKYLLKKYPTRQYSILKGQSVTPSEGKSDLNEWFHIWITTRQHNIDRMFQALNDYDYSPIENVDRYENETINKDIDTTYGKTQTHSGTDTLTQSGTISDAHTGTIADAHSGTITTVDSGKDTTTNSGSVTHETEKAGFNSPNTYTNTEKVTDLFNNRKEELTHGKTETETLNNTDTQTFNNSDTQAFNKSDATLHGHVISDSGSDLVDDDTIRTLRVHGNIGVTTNNQLIESELNMRMMSLAEMLLDNFVDDATFYS